MYRAVSFLTECECNVFLEIDHQRAAQTNLKATTSDDSWLAMSASHTQQQPQHGIQCVTEQRVASCSTKALNLRLMPFIVVQ